MLHAVWWECRLSLGWRIRWAGHGVVRMLVGYFFVLSSACGRSVLCGTSRLYVLQAHVHPVLRCVGVFGRHTSCVYGRCAGRCV